MATDRLSDRKQLIDQLSQSDNPKQTPSSARCEATYKRVKNKLSHRELELASLLTQGLGTKEVAKKLGISWHTVQKHKRNIKSKLCCKTTVQTGYWLFPLIPPNSQLQNSSQSV